MHIAITGGSGFIGGAVRTRLQQAGHTVALVSLRAAPAPDAFAGCDAVVHLAGEPVAQRWTADARQRISNSRVEGTRKLVAALRSRPPAVLISASAVGYYGSRGDQILTETSAPGRDFLSDVCVAWEREALAAQSFGVRVVTPRFGVVLGKTAEKPGGALAQMLLPFKLGVGGRLGSGRQWMSWIHLHDLTALIEFALGNPALTGPVNATAPNPVTNAEFTRELAAVLRRPAIFTVPPFALRLFFGEMSRMLLEGQRVTPAAALRSNFPFQYAELASALRQILA